MRRDDMLMIYGYYTDVFFFNTTVDEGFSWLNRFMPVLQDLRRELIHLRVKGSS